MSWYTHVIVIYPAGLTLNLSHIIFWDVAYQSEEVLLIYDYDLENFREKKSKYAHPVTVRGQLRPLRITLSAATKVLDELSRRTQIFVVCLHLVLPIFHRQNWVILALDTNPISRSISKSISLNKRCSEKASGDEYHRYLSKNLLQPFSSHAIYVNLLFY